MAHPVYQGSGLPEHFTKDGDPVAIKIVINVHASGAMSIKGPLEDEQWMLAALDHAKDAIRGHHTSKHEILIPTKDVQLP